MKAYHCNCRDFAQNSIGRNFKKEHFSFRYDINLNLFIYFNTERRHRNFKTDILRRGKWKEGIFIVNTNIVELERNVYDVTLQRYFYVTRVAKK